MNFQILRLIVLGFSASLLLFGQVPLTFAQEMTPSKSSLWMEVKGKGPVSVLFVCGNGADCSVWTKFEKDVRKLGVRTVVYDRNGIGKSPLWKGDYSIEKEVENLKTALKAHNVSGPIVLVPHSYGGLIGSAFAFNNPKIQGAVLVDAVLPKELSKPVVDGILKKYRPQYDILRKRAPELAKAIIPLLEAYPKTARITSKYKFHPTLPVIDIRAEVPAAASKEEENHSREVHRKFVASSKSRQSVLATKSGHQVMKDRPDVVLAAIKKLLKNRSSASKLGSPSKGLKEMDLKRQNIDQ